MQTLSHLLTNHWNHNNALASGSHKEITLPVAISALTVYTLNISSISHPESIKLYILLTNYVFGKSFWGPFFPDSLFKSCKIIHVLHQGFSINWAKSAKISFYFLCFWKALKFHMWHLCHLLRKPVLHAAGQEKILNMTPIAVIPWPSRG